MIKLFRNVRRNLLAEGKTTKYLKYAIGEIILVVIGILIALWLNQRASYNHERQNEITILKEITNNLKSDLIEIDDDLWVMDSTDVACDFVLNYLNTADIPNRQFGAKALIIKSTPHFNPNKSGYNLLQSKGVEIIRDDSLRRTISYHYESTYPYYDKYEQERIEFRIHTVDPFLDRHFSWVANPSSPYLGEFEITQEDYTKLKSEKQFYKLVTVIKGENNLVRNRALRLRASINGVISFLENELDDR